MKKSFSRSSRPRQRSGFTLVELLVVIAIIGILAAAAFPVITGAINNAKRAKSSALCGQIKTAIAQYQTEYSAYPNAQAAATDSYYSGANLAAAQGAKEDALIYALCGNNNPANPAGAAPGDVVTTLNTRNIAYLTVSKTDTDGVNPLVKQPLTYSGGGTQYFYIAMDTDYSNITGDSGGSTLPDFTQTGATFKGTLAAGAGTRITDGIAVWANNDENPATSTTPNRWSHTY